MKQYKTVMVIAGSDSGGGAGIQADLKTITSLGGFATTALTALTAQNTQAVEALFPVTPQFVQQQIHCIWTDMGAHAIKIGMLQGSEIIEVVAKCLKEMKEVPVVLDPVMVATSGDRLLEKKARATLVEKLFSQAFVVTPNVYEASVLVGKPIKEKEQMKEACYHIHQMGARNVYLKGGDLPGQWAWDYLFEGDCGQLSVLKTPKVPTVNTHGTGCSFSSALAFYLAQGLNLLEAAQKAKSYVYGAILSGSHYKIGSGKGPIHHAWAVERRQL